MSYYLLQKTKAVCITPTISSRPIRNMTSTSVFLMCKDIQRELVNMCIYDGIVSYADIIQFVNPYEYIFSPCPRTQTSVCSLKPNSNLYYELSEVFDTIDIPITNPYCFINSKFPDDIMKCVKKQYPTMAFHASSQYGFVYTEINHSISLDHYVTEMASCLTTLLQSQTDNGVAIVRVNYLFHRPILDTIYILSSMYEKVYIMKPNTSNAMSQDKYIVCINKVPNPDLYKANCKNLINNRNKRLYSLVDHNLPLNFVNKMNDINVILGQRQLEYFDHALTIMSSANKYEAINCIVAKNMQKCASMCEKLGLPYVKTNIFLDKR
jgi:hypothetical protein